MVRQKVRTRFLLFKKKSKGNEKGKSPILTFEKNHIIIKRYEEPNSNWKKQQQTNKQANIQTNK